MGGIRRLWSALTFCARMSQIAWYVRDTNQRVAAQESAEAIKAECCKIADNLKRSTIDELNKQYPPKQ